MASSSGGAGAASTPGANAGGGGVGTLECCLSIDSGGDLGAGS